MTNALEAEVRKIVAAHPDTVYQKIGGTDCSYTKGAAGGSQGCLLGQAISALHPDIFKAEIYAETGEYIRDLCQNYPTLKQYADRSDWFQDVQTYQDYGQPWGECVALADELEEIDNENN